MQDKDTQMGREGGGGARKIKGLTHKRVPSLFLSFANPITYVCILGFNESQFLSEFYGFLLVLIAIL
jgi:hypothetical protein